MRWDSGAGPLTVEQRALTPAEVAVRCSLDEEGHTNERLWEECRRAVQDPRMS